MSGNTQSAPVKAVPWSRGRQARLLPLHALALLLSCSHAPVALTPENTGLAPLAWLVGNWVSSGERYRTHESWQWADDGTMEGVGRSESLETGDIEVTETLRLVARDGDVLYVPTVAHNPGPVVFRLVQHERGRFVFENPEHDFPKRIVYEQLAGDRMRVSVSGDNKRGFTIEFGRRQPD